MKTTFTPRALVVGLAASPLAAFAQEGPDLSAITAAGVTVAAIGAAVFAVHIGIKVWQWARRASN